MANLIRTFLDYYRNVADPYPDEDTPFYHPFCSDPAVQLATIVNSLERNAYFVAVLMASSDHSPVFAVAPPLLASSTTGSRGHLEQVCLCR
jgi:hypothetical protein